MSIHPRHDSLFKFAFSKPEHAASAVAAILPADLKRQIDFSNFELQPGSYVDEAFKHRHADLLYRTTRPDNAADTYVYLLFEHQSTPDNTMPLRVLSYMVNIWNRFVDDHPGAALPPIIPVVLYHGARSWQAPTALAEMFSPVVAQGPLGAHQPTARFIIDDLSTVSNDALRSRALTGMAHVALGTLKHAHDGPAVLDWWRSSVASLLEVWQAADGLRAIEMLIRYILHTNDVPKAAVVETVGDTLGQTAQEVAMTTAQQLYEDGRVDGRVEGALALCTLRYGGLSANVKERIEALDNAGLDVIYQQINFATTSDALLALAEAAGNE